MFTSDISARLVTCVMEAGRGGTFAEVSQIAFANIPGTPGYNVQVPVVGLKASVLAGAETGRVQCREASGGTLTFRPRRPGGRGAPDRIAGAPCIAAVSRG